MDGFAEWWQSIDWGTAPDWLAAIGTVGALFLGLSLFWVERNRLLREHADKFVTWLRVSQVAGKKNDDEFKVTFHAFNGGTAPILEALVTPHPKYARLAPTPGMILSMHDDGDMSIQPGASVRMTTSFAESPRGVPFVISFHDSNGRRWVRDIESSRYYNGWQRFWMRRAHAKNEKLLRAQDRKLFEDMRRAAGHNTPL